MSQRDFDRMTQKLRRRADSMVSRATIAAIDDASGIQSLQIEGLADEAHDGAERMQDYGFTSHPHADAEAVVVFAGGLRSHPLIVAVGDRRYRFKDLQPGEVAMYDDQGQVVHLTRDGIVISTSLKVTIEAAGDLLIKSDAKVKVEAPQVVVQSNNIELGGGGGAAVARVGDPVVGGVIASGSTKVKAA